MKFFQDFIPMNRSRRSTLAKLMVMDPCHTNATHSTVQALPEFLQKGDVLVFNNAGTLPASFHFETERGVVEVRLISNRSSQAQEPFSWTAVAYQGGDWRQKTEDRQLFRTSKPLWFDDRDGVRVKLSPDGQAFHVEFIGQKQDVWNYLFQKGAPIQYSYHKEALELWDVQTIFAGQPLAIEAPSAALHFDWSLIQDLKAKGVKIAFVSHAAGVSATGFPSVDVQLPLAEPYWIPTGTVDAIHRAQKSGHRVIGIGTSATRCLEASAAKGALEPGFGVASIHLHKGFPLKVVDGLLSGLHERDSSHLRLLEAFIEKEKLLTAYNEAVNRGYRHHEFGDLELLCKKCSSF